MKSSIRLLSQLIPIIDWLPRYQIGWLLPDLIAGITLAAYAVPVAMAYATLAGLAPQAGLYCYIFSGIAYALFALAVAVTFWRVPPQRRGNRRWR